MSPLYLFVLLPLNDAIYMSNSVCVGTLLQLVRSYSHLRACCGCRNTRHSRTHLGTGHNGAAGVYSHGSCVEPQFIAGVSLYADECCKALRCCGHKPCATLQRCLWVAMIKLRIAILTQQTCSFIKCMDLPMLRLDQRESSKACVQSRLCSGLLDADNTTNRTERA